MEIIEVLSAVHCVQYGNSVVSTRVLVDPDPLKPARYCGFVNISFGSRSGSAELFPNLWAQL